MRYPKTPFHVADVDSWLTVSRWLALLLLLIGINGFQSDLSAQGSAPAIPYERLKSMSLEELMETTVTSVSRAPERLFDTASAIQVVSSQDIRRSGATILPEALRLANNLNVAQKNSHDWGISARGFNTDLANKLLVMIDGRTIYTPLFSGVRWDVQDYILEDVDRIEIISGPGGALWGANAVNGVINIISKSARESQGLYLEAAGGDHLNGAFALRYGSKLAPNVFYRVYAKSFDRDDQVFAGGANAGDSWHLNQAGFRVDAASSENTFTLQGDLYEGKEGFSSGGKADLDGSNLLGRWSRAFSDLSEMKLQLFYDRAHFRQPVAQSGFGAAGFFSDRLETYDLDFQHRIRVPILRQFVWGLGYRNTDDQTSAAPGIGFDPPHLRQQLFSGFGQIEVTLPRDVSLTLGSKIEHNDYTGWEFEPSGRFDWKPAARSTLWGAVSRAVRTPSRVDRDILQPSRSPIILKGGPQFSSENVLAFELGYRNQLSDRFSLAVAGFLNRYDHVRSVSRTPVTVLPFYFANDLEGKTYGAELTANFQATQNWRLLAGYTRLIEDIVVRAGGADLNNALNETADPKQQFSLRSSLDLGKSVELDTNFRWVDSLRVNSNGSIGVVPCYGELDLRLAWRVTAGTEVALVGQNLLYGHHPEFGTPSPTRVEINRSLYVKATWHY